MGKHHIFVHVVDSQGSRLPGIPLKIVWGPDPSDAAYPITDATGWVEFAMFYGVYSVQVATGSSQVVSGLTPDIPIEEICEENGAIGNSPGHYSYEVIFAKVR